MPPAQFPPTPGSSTDIRGKAKLISLAPALSLPPAAVINGSDRSSLSPPSANGSDSSYRPASPRSPEVNRQTQSSTSQSQLGKADTRISLPPPPGRARKIIQMKPKDNTTEQDHAAATKAVGGRKKGSSATTASGRKTARKTAHSLIERRRRSKMNEEFGVLKDMIPACSGQEMHKLAILQASIDYLRYLKSCVSDLNAANGPSKHAVLPLQQGVQAREQSSEQMDEEQGDSDEEMSVDDATVEKAHPPMPATAAPMAHAQSYASLPSLQSLPSISQLTTVSTISPSIYATDHRHYSISSASAPSFSPYIVSQQTSPFFGPQYTSSQYACSASKDDAHTFVLDSPALKAQDTHQELKDDHEAMAALLMLNTDRRRWSSDRDAPARSRAGGMSVQDLLRRD